MAGTKTSHTRNAAHEFLGPRDLPRLDGVAPWSDFSSEKRTSETGVGCYQWRINDPNGLATLVQDLSDSAAREGLPQHVNFQEIPLSQNPTGDWIAQNYHQLAKFVGQYVAIHPRLGIIAHGKNFLKVHTQVQASDAAQDVVIDLVSKR